MSQWLKEYVVTVKEYNFLEEFYSDMENESTKEFIPSRLVECVKKRPVSRNTHYMITDEEARNLRNDVRVESVNLIIDPEIVKLKQHSSQTSTWNRGPSIQTGEKNWGLYRSTLEQNIAQWGGETGSNTEISSVTFSGTGKNVDIIIVDETLYPDHPEYADRFVAYNWFANHNATVWPGNPNNNYTYSNFSFANNHATHVASIAAGRTSGWAKDANIYNIRHDSVGFAAGSFLPPEFLIDYIREFHRTKPINPVTGRKNPTLVNNSWGFEVSNNNLNALTGFSSSSISNIFYRGSQVQGAGPVVDTGISGVYTSTAKIEDINVAPGSGNRILTTDIDQGTVTSITFSDTNRAGLTNLGSPTAFDPEAFGELDDAIWQITPPFTVDYLTQSYSNIFVNSNSYVTFGSGSFEYFLGPAGPNIRKIFVSGDDRSASSVWTGTFGTAPNRTFVVRYEGFSGAFSSTFETVPTIIWEMRFYENQRNQIDVHVIQNSAYRSEFTVEELTNYGIAYNIGSSPIRNLSIDADIADAIDEGIVFVSSAGNNATKIDIEGGLDYNNYFVDNGFPVSYHQGTSPGASHPDMICVGSLDSSTSEGKSQSSNTGPGVQLYAPGSNITAAVFDSTGSLGLVVGDRSLVITSGHAGNNGLPGQSSGLAVITTASAHNLTSGDIITIDNCSQSEFNTLNATVTVLDSTSFRYTISDTGYTTGVISLTGNVKAGGLFQKFNGSSMAAAQVTGLVALALEQYPWMTQADAKEYITRYAKTGLMFTTEGSYGDLTSLQGGANRIAFMFRERPEQGVLIPKSRQWLRPTTGQAYPRPRIKR